MRIISKNCLDAFGDTLLRSFQNRTLAHMKKCFPRECNKLGDPVLVELVRYASQRASAYGFVSEQDVCKYVDLTLLFGRDFDRDPSLGWAEAILLDPDFKSPTERAGELYDQGMASYV